METHVDLRPELKQLEHKVSIVSLIQNYNQSLEKRQQLLSNAQVDSHCLHIYSLIYFQDALIQALEAVEYHEHFESLFDRYNQWMKDAEHRLEKLTSTIENRSNYDIEQYYRNIEVTIFSSIP